MRVSEGQLSREDPTVEWVDPGLLGKFPLGNGLVKTGVLGSGDLDCLLTGGGLVNAYCGEALRVPTGVLAGGLQDRGIVGKVAARRQMSSILSAGVGL